MPEADTRTVDQKLIDANFFRDQEAVYKLFTKMRQEDPVLYIPSNYVFGLASACVQLERSG